MNEELVGIIKEKGLLLEREIYDVLNVFNDKESVKVFLDMLEKKSGQKIITKSTLSKNIEFVQNFINNSSTNEDDVEKVFIKLGISLEVTKEKSVAVASIDPLKKDNSMDYQVFYSTSRVDKKLEVSDFVGNFRARYQSLQRILMGRPELQNLTSISKISNSDRQNVSLIGLVSEKRVTKNKNLIIKVEDLTGVINVLVKFDKPEVFKKAEELIFDEVIGIRASGTKEMLFAHDIIFPDSIVLDKVRFEEDYNIAFISDIHCGSDRHLGEKFERFLEWLNSDNEYAKKIKYIFISGDNVDGVGVFPGQQNSLKLKSMKEQYNLLNSYLSKVPKNITMFMCPGQHDATRVAEPQPIIDKRYAGELHNIDNLILVTNPSLIKLKEKDKEFKVLMYHGDSIHTFINEIKELRELKAKKTPAKAVKFMLRKRHLFPIHSESIYIPNVDRDPLVIYEVPDLVCTGEVHRIDIDNYNGTLIITSGCWQSTTPFEEKVGNIPDPAKVPVFNIKTRELRIFDFSEEEQGAN